MTDEPKISTCLTGIIRALPEVDTCMDGATHAIETPLHKDLFRLKAANDTIRKELDQLVDAKTYFTVCGYVIKGAECDHLEVHIVELGSDFEEKLSRL